MKKYIVRNIAWIFDDDWYNFDGEINLEGIYDSKMPLPTAIYGLTMFIPDGFMMWYFGKRKTG